MCDILEAAFTKVNSIDVDHQTCEGLLDHFRYKLGLVAESVEKLPETYMKASTNDIVNELHNTIHRIQLDDSIDSCVEIINAVKCKFLPHFKNEIEIIVENMNLIKSTWEMCHSQYGKSFTDSSEIENEEMTEDLTSTLYLSNSFIKVVNDCFEYIATRNVKDETNSELSQFLDFGTSPTTDIELFGSDNNNNYIPFANDNRYLHVENIGHEFWKIDDMIDGFPAESMNDCNNDILELAMETIADSLIASHTIKDPSIQGQKLAVTANLQQDTECLGQEMLNHSENELVQLEVNSSEQKPNTDMFSRQNELIAASLNSNKEQIFSRENESCIETKQTKIDYFPMSYSRSERLDPDTFSKVCSKCPIKLKARSLSSVLVEESDSERLENLPNEFLNYFHPKTKEGVFEAVAKVFEYLQEESKWARKLSRRNKINPSRKTKLSKPEMPLEVRMYIKLGILPWDLKNKECKPADDSHCQIRIPEEIKTAVLRYRSWYPTMHEKLYCFENHSKYLFDLELFGCWECIRKYYNEIYKWANKSGLVLREVRMY